MADKDLTPADKEWLDLAWKYFQQHAQQRITYLNYFVVLSTVLTTGLVTTFQYNFNLPILGVAIGCVQSFLAFVFWKIDVRNKFLTKNAENIIKNIEQEYDADGAKSYKLFSDEEELTKELREKEKDKFFLNRQISHGQLYRYLYAFFFIIGLLGATTSIVFSLRQKPMESNQQNLTTVNIQLNKIDSLSSAINAQADVISKIQNDVTKLKQDSLVYDLMKSIMALRTELKPPVAPAKAIPANKAASKK